VIGPDGVVRLVADINPTGSSFADNFTAVGDNVYFTATTASNGGELWKMAADGIVSMVPEVSAGSQSSQPDHLIAFGGTLYFTAYNSTFGFELFKLGPDGAPVLVRDIDPLASSSNPQGFTIFNGEMYFSATEGFEGFELWKVKADGTVVQFHEINPGFDGSSPSGFTEFNGSLYFAARGPGSDSELWRIAPDGHVLPVASINPAGGSDPHNFTIFNGALYFTADDGTHGTELWKVGADGAVSMEVDLDPGSSGSSLGSLTATDWGLYFSADIATSGREVWVLEPGGLLTQVTDLVPGPNPSMSSPFHIGVHETMAPLVTPTITSTGGGATASISIAENVKGITTVTASDADGGTAGLHFALSGADVQLFSIGAGGQLSFISAPDFEKPTDSGSDNVYNVNVTAIDADGLSDTQALAVTVTNVKGITYNGTSGNNSKTGTAEKDTLNGNAGNDKLKGGGARDTINGGTGNDKIVGGTGNDKLTGGSGKDAFVFNTALASAGIDKLTDFSHANDTFRLEDSIFMALGASVANNEFVARASGHAATKASHHLIYDKSQGSLWYDADGKGVGAAVQIAQLGTASLHPLNLAYDDFAIV
jgi:ELWxxDGT repeat protein